MGDEINEPVDEKCTKENILDKSMWDELFNEDLDKPNDEKKANGTILDSSVWDELDNENQNKPVDEISISYSSHENILDGSVWDELDNENQNKPVDEISILYSSNENILDSSVWDELSNKDQNKPADDNSAKGNILDIPMWDEIVNEDISDHDSVQDHLKHEQGVPKFQLSPVQTGITCILCGETNFESASALVLHRFDTHKYKCPDPDCDKEYKITWSIQRHVNKNHNIQDKITCCRFCNKVFYDVNLKLDHISNMHADCSDNTPEKASKLKEQRNLLEEEMISVYNPSALGTIHKLRRHKRQTDYPSKVDIEGDSWNLYSTDVWSTEVKPFSQNFGKFNCKCCIVRIGQFLTYSSANGH